MNAGWPLPAVSPACQAQRTSPFFSTQTLLGSSAPLRCGADGPPSGGYRSCQQPAAAAAANDGGGDGGVTAS